MQVPASRVQALRRWDRAGGAGACPEKEKLWSCAFAADAVDSSTSRVELSEATGGSWAERGMDVRTRCPRGQGSEETALEVVAAAKRVPVHYCSSSFKDSVQLRKRIKRRALRIALPSDVITEEGTLLKGVVEGPVDEIAAMLRDRFEVPPELFRKDEEKKRVEVAPWVLEEIFSELPYESFLVEEYPTADRLEVEREPLRPR